MTSKIPIRILIVEDSEDDAFLLIREVSESEYEPTFERIETQSEMEAALKNKSWDVITSDYNMPYFSGLRALQVLKESGLDLPFLIVSGAIGEEVAVDLMRAGAHDYIMKGNLKRLPPAIKREVCEAENRRGRKKAEGALQIAFQAQREAEAKYHDIYETAPDMYATVDIVSQRIVQCNQTFIQALGYEKSEIIGQSVFSIYAPAWISRARKAFQVFVETRQIHDVELQLITKTGLNIDVNLSASFIHDPDGKADLGSCSWRDGTVRKRSENFLQQAKIKLEQSIRMRDEFLAIASHEFKTPITSLKFHLQMAQQKMAQQKIISNQNLSVSAARIATSLDISIQQVDRLIRLVNELSDVSEMQAGKLILNVEEVNLADLVRTVLVRFNDELIQAKCPLKLDLDEKIVGRWDQSRLEQVITNLISNEIKYGAGFPVTIRVFRKNGFAVLSVEDAGHGIAKEKQAKLFERFERATSSRNITGLGLGLFIIKQICLAHQGTVRIESEEGKGIKFIVEIPLNS